MIFRRYLVLSLALACVRLPAPEPSASEIAETRAALVQLGPAVRVETSKRLDHLYFFGADGVLKRKEAPQAIPKLPIPLNASGKNNVGAAMELIAATKSGGELLGRLLPEWQKGNIEVRALTPAVREKLGVSAGGFCEPDLSAPGKFVVYVDPSAPPGELAAVLFHELFHASSPEDQKEMRQLETKRLALVDKKAAVEKGGSATEFMKAAGEFERERQEITLKLELRAHRAHEAYVKELVEEFPQSAIFYKYLTKVGALTENSSEAGIISSYKLNRLPRNQSPCGSPLKRIAS